MILNYQNRLSPAEVLSGTKCAVLKAVRQGNASSNFLIKGDNLEVMQTLWTTWNMTKNIDLVYIDPPFSTNNIFRHNSRRTQTISQCPADEIAYSDTLTGSDFLEFLRERLIMLRQLMSEQSSIYVHIDYKIGHYVKLIMDEIFGQEMFRSDITRIKCNPKNFSRRTFGNIKDMILFYSTEDAVWNEPFQPQSEENIWKLFPKIDKSGRRYTTTPLHAPGETLNGNTGKTWKGIQPPKGRHWRYDPEVLDELDRKGLIEWSKTSNPRKIIYADQTGRRGKKLQDIWEFKDPQYPVYPTEKNMDLLKLIVATSSMPGQTVLDCFCGSGTALLAAHELNRHWIGIDTSDAAIEKVMEKLAPHENNLFDSGGIYGYFEQIGSVCPPARGSRLSKEHRGKNHQCTGKK